MVLVTIAKIADVEQVGQFALALAISAPIVLFTGMNLRVALASDAMGEYEFGEYVGLRLLGYVPVLGIVTGIVLLRGYPLTLSALIIWITLHKLIEDTCSIFTGRYQLHDRMDIAALSSVLRGFTGLSVFVLLLLWTRNLLLSVMARTFCSITVLLTYDRIRAAKFGPFRPVFSPSRLWKLVAKTFPLAVVMGVMSLRTNIPRYLLADYCGEDMLGYYSAIAFLLQAMLLPMEAMSTASIARLAKFFVESRKRFVRLFLILLLIAMVSSVFIIMMCWLFGKWALGVVYRPEYAEHWNILFIGAIGAGFAFFVSMGSASFTATRKFRWHMAIYVIILIATLISCYLLIPQYGIVGAAWANVIVTAIHSLIFLVAIGLSLRKIPKEASAKNTTITS